MWLIKTLKNNNNLGYNINIGMDKEEFDERKIAAFTPGRKAGVLKVISTKELPLLCNWLIRGTLFLISRF